MKARAKIQSVNTRAPKISLIDAGIPNTESI
jgi:hypothetical protein